MPTFPTIIARASRSPRLIQLITIILFGTAITFELTPVGGKFSPDDNQYSQIKTEERKIIDTIKPGEKTSKVLKFSYNFLLNAKIIIQAKLPEGGGRADVVYDADFEIKWGVLVLNIGIMFVITLSTSLLFDKTVVVAYAKNELKSIADIDDLSLSDSTPAVMLLKQEVYAGQRHASMLFRRATYMLVSGVLMAFVGVSTFASFDSLAVRHYQVDNEDFRNYESMRIDRANIGNILSLMPQNPNESDKKAMLSVLGVASSQRLDKSNNINFAGIYQIFRPMGTLLFLETIAWFLLRQYRSLLEDYKVFYRSYLQRANRLIVFKIISSTDYSEQFRDFSAELLQDVKVGALNKDQTTEYLENLKQIDQNPLNEWVGKLIDKIPGR